MGIKLPVRPQSLGEEIGNAVSHGLGALLSVAGMIILIMLGAAKSNAAAVVLAVIYGVSLIILYLSSTLYHSLPRGCAKNIFQILDHCSIFLLISGTYAPISVSMIGGKIGYSLIIINSACAVFGILLNAVDMEKWKKISMFIYIIMGWMCLFTLDPLINAAPKQHLWLLVGGGIAYTLGIFFFAMNKIKYMHFIWHLFVLAGSALQYFFILFACYI